VAESLTRYSIILGERGKKKCKMKNAKCKMQGERRDLGDRLLDFATETIPLVQRIGKTVVGRHIANELLRSVTSAGANYEEACAAESRADFVHKLQIVLKESRESLYWLKLTKKAQLVSNEAIDSLEQEARQICNIIGKSVTTAKKRRT
jgi:four helix bundle protein